MPSVPPSNAESAPTAIDEGDRRIAQIADAADGVLPWSASITEHLIGLLVVVIVTAGVIIAIRLTTRQILRRFDVQAENNLRARQVHTQARVLSRTAQTIALVLGFGAALMTFEGVEQLGASLLASAGLVGIIVGFAARPSIGNLIAGLQIAITQPIRLDDVVIVEGEWGWIEEIRSTYVVVKIWDDRRLIVPLSKFIDEPFQNWTRRTSQLLGTVFIHADYSVDVDAVRAELRRLCEASPQWDQRVAIVQVTGATEQTVELRALVSAASSPKLWDLRVYVREGLIQHLKREQPEALPKSRAVIRRDGESGLEQNLRRPDAKAQGLEQIGVETHALAELDRAAVDSDARASAGADPPKS